MAQEQIRPQRKDGSGGDGPDVPDPVAPAGQERRAQMDSDLDSLLGEIDGVLETNAEEFVKGFVQKGGQ